MLEDARIPDVILSEETEESSSLRAWAEGGRLMARWMCCRVILESPFST